MTVGLVSCLQYEYLSGCSDVIDVGRVLESEINIHSYLHYTILFRSKVLEK